MSAVRQTLTLFRGDAWTITDVIKNADGTPVDVSGWTPVLTMRTKDDAPDPPVVSKAGTVPVGADGKLVFTFTEAETLAIPAGQYAFTVKRTNAANGDTLTYGVITVKLDVLNHA